jgi:predicted nuclease of predicted toxin-antitoxin system
LLERPVRSRLLHSKLGLTSLGLTALLVVPLGGSFFNLLARSRRQAEARRIEELVAQSLRKETITLGRDSDLESLRIVWDQDPPLIVVRVNVSDPRLPSFKQVADVQAFINAKLAPRRFRLVVQRTAIEVVGPESAPNPPELQVMPFWSPPPALPPIPKARPVAPENSGPSRP